MEVLDVYSAVACSAPPGQPEKVDSVYIRNGVAGVFMKAYPPKEARQMAERLFGFPWKTQGEKFEASGRDIMEFAFQSCYINNFLPV